MPGSIVGGAAFLDDRVTDLRVRQPLAGLRLHCRHDEQCNGRRNQGRARDTDVDHLKLWDCFGSRFRTAARMLLSACFAGFSSPIELVAIMKAPPALRGITM